MELGAKGWSLGFMAHLKFVAMVLCLNDYRLEGGTIIRLT